MLYGYITIIRKEYHGAGLATALMPDFDAVPYMGSSNHLSIARRTLSGRHWLEKRHGMNGFVQKARCEMLVLPTVAGIRIEEVTRQTADQLLAYDKIVCRLDRREFVEKWSLPPEENAPDKGRSVVALEEKSGACVGYGTIRKFSDYYGRMDICGEAYGLNVYHFRYPTFIRRQ